MNDKDKSISLFLENFIPKHIQDSSSGLVNLLKNYYDWCEEEANIHKVMHEFGETFNEEFVSKYYDKIKYEYFPSVPEKIYIEKSTFLKNAKTVFSSKGTEDSIRFFFKSIFDESVSIEYPVQRPKLAHERKKLFLCSAVKNLTYNKYKKYLELVGGHIRQDNDGALAYVESVQFKTDTEYDQNAFYDETMTYVIRGYSYVYIEISNKHFDNFISRDSNFEYVLVRKSNSYGIVEENAFSFKIENMLGNVKLLNSGIDYSVGDILEINFVDATVYDTQILKKCTAVVAKISLTGGIEQIIFVDPGVGFDMTEYYTETAKTNDGLPSIGSGASIIFTSSAEYDENQNIVYFLEQNLHQKYKIKTALETDLYKDLFIELAHPAGIVFESELTIITETDAQMFKV